MLLAGCAPTPPRVQPDQVDPSTAPAYLQAVSHLSNINREAQRMFETGKLDRASALIQKGQPLISQALAVPRPPLAAMEAASDLDQLYGRMLLSNRHYEWARLQFQKNRMRWKNWTPRTGETERRRKAAEDAIAECDRGMSK